jgi:radical SAM superfamily enzyme YgiQ (UPF0313 family)
VRVLFVYNEVESLGLQYLSSALRHAGHETGLVFDPRLFDFFRREYANRFLARMFSFRNELMERIEEFQPEVVGFQVLTANADWCEGWARAIRERFPDVTLVAGGYHATASGQAVLESGAYDWVIRGEAEDALVELVDSLEDGAVDRTLPNLAYRDEDGTYIENPLRPYEQDLDRYHEPDKELFWRLGPPFTVGHLVEWRRGCPWGCTFCGNNYYRRIYYPGQKDYMYTKQFLRSRSVDSVLAELRHVKATYAPRVMRINDDDVCADEEWLRELSERMTDAERIPFKCFAIPNNINERTIVYLKKIGCSQIQMGVQSLNPDIRKLIGRPNSDAQIARAIDLCAQQDIGLFVDQIFGLPTETEDDCKKLERFYTEHRPDCVSVYWLDIWAGADVLQQAVDAGTITQETAEAIRQHSQEGDISTRRKYHNSFARPYATRLEVHNNYKPRTASLILKTGLWRLWGALNLFRFTRVWYAWKHARQLDRWPSAKEGYDLSWARFPRFFQHYMGMRMKSWFSRKNPLPLVRRAPVGLPRCERPLEERGRQTPQVPVEDLVPQEHTPSGTHAAA